MLEIYIKPSLIYEELLTVIRKKKKTISVICKSSHTIKMNSKLSSSVHRPMQIQSYYVDKQQSVELMQCLFLHCKV